MTRLRRILNSISNHTPSILNLLRGAAIGLVLLLSFSRLRLALGATSDLLLAVAVTTVLAAFIQVLFIKNSSRWLTCVTCFIAACWLFIQPLIINSALQSVRQFTLSSLVDSWFQFGISFVIVLTSLLPVLLATTVLNARSKKQHGLFAAGIALALLGGPIAIGLFSSPIVATWGTALLLVLLGAAEFWPHREQVATHHHQSKQEQTFPIWEGFAFQTSLGFGIALAVAIGQQFMLDHLLSELSLYGGLFVGVALAALIPFRLSNSTKWWSLGSWAALVVLLYSLLTYSALSATVWISSPLWLFLTRSALLISLTLPLGYFLGQSRTLTTSVSTNFLTTTTSCTIGLAVAYWSRISPTACLTILLAVSLSFGIVRFLLQAQWRTPLGHRIGFASCFSVVVAGLLMASNLNPGRTEKVLFTGNTYAAFRGGLDWKLLPWIDDARLVEEHASLSDRWSLWKQRGQQSTSRKNGLVTEIKSDNMTACPLNAAEAMPGLFSLVAHPTAEHVLILGMHATTIHTCEEFPLQTVTVIEGSEFFEEIQTWATARMMDQTNFQFINTRIPLAVQSQHAQKYDVVIAPQTMVAVSDGMSQLTEEFYQGVYSQMNENGLFCQRLTFYDIGPAMVKQLTATVQKVFPQVLIIESVPGELLVLGTSRQESLVNEGLVERLQTPQTRRILSHVGWDWAIPASKGTLDGAASAKWVGNAETALSVARLDSAFHLPIEIARWDTKSAQTRQALAKHGMSLGGYLGEGDEALDIQQRLEDLNLAQNILNNNSDNIWGYRAALKKQLTERPRAKIMQVKHEGLKRKLHPDDQRRKDYLETLGALAKTETPTLEMVNRLIEFMQPFDPLLGPFVCNEAIHQLRRINLPTEQTEYETLLYSIYFSTAADKSVRNVCMATKILCENPGIVDGDADRWDQLNGLMEIFRHRWHLRFADRSKQSSYELIDTERSIEAIKAAMEEMEELASQAGLSDRDWQARQTILEETLIRPLRLHRSQQLRSQKVATVTGQ